MTLRRKTIFYSLFVVILAVIIVFIYFYRGKIAKIIIPFIMAMVIAYILQPIVIKLEEKKIKRSVAIILIYAIIAGVLTLLTFFVFPELINNTREFINVLPNVTMEYRENFNGMVSLIYSSKWPEDIKNAIFREINNSVQMAENILVEALKNTLSRLLKTVSTLLDLVLAMVIAYYIMKDGEYFKNVSLSLIPKKWRNGILGTCREINGVLSNFIQGQLLTALIVGTLEVIGLLLVGVKYPIILGMIGGIANIIPYFGPFIGAIPAVAVALIESPMKAIWTIIVFVVIQQLDNGFISPKIIEGRLGLHPVTTILAVLIGGEFFGIMGMLVSVPIAAMIKVIGKRAIESIV